MVSLTKSKHGWRVQLSVKGVRDSCRFATKAEAQAWAVEREVQLRGHVAQRQYVHLSREMSVAKQVGARHGKPVVLLIDAQAMAANGHHFYLSENGVWLTNAIPVKYIREMPV